MKTIVIPVHLTHTALAMCLFVSHGFAGDPPPFVPFAKAVEMLRQAEGESLQDFLGMFEFRLQRPPYSDEEIDLLLAELKRVEANDSYQVWREGKGGKRLVYPNRIEATHAIERLLYEKEARPIRRLPISQQVAESFRLMENPPVVTGRRIGWGIADLAELGSAAVPHILEYKPANTYYRVRAVEVLAAIGDPRAVDYIIETLSLVGERPDQWGDTCHALSSFKTLEARDALITALEDEAFVMTERNPRQQMRSATEKDFEKPARYDFKRAHAANALGGVTGKNWGPVFNEDADTWKAWRAGGCPERFDPRSIPRSMEQSSQLAEMLLHAYMCGRSLPIPARKHEYASVDFDSPAAVARIAEDLGSLGPDASAHFADVGAERIRTAPLWRTDLGYWMKRVLAEVKSPDSEALIARVNEAIRQTEPDGR